MDVIARRSPFRYYGPDLGHYVRGFETALAAKLGVRHALGVTSGTSALIVALRALGVGPGDEVIVPAATFVASALAVVACNAVPIFADVDASLGLDAKDAETRISARTKAIMPVHFLGMPVDMEPLLALARRRNLAVVEDCAQSCGASYRGRPIGSMGAINAFSLQMNKIISSGEGGAVTTDDPVLYERAVRAHDQGGFRDGKGVVEPFCGENYRMSELIGAVAGEQLKKLDGIVAHMRGIRDRLTAGLAGRAGFVLRQSPDPGGDIGDCVSLIFASAEQRRRVTKILAAENIGLHNLYAGQPAYLTPQIQHKRVWHEKASPWSSAFYDGEITYEAGLCPQSETLLARMGSFLIGPEWQARDVDDILTAFDKIKRAKAGAA
ncbi:MAG TPA: DegT/DnrJ/EryC1/StrS family aminotransferase, partial [Limnochordia bacterium]|nr:DegT/DnrJ/EryC1/StrS family aminotransferase [Limnochordia bacterium]